MFTNPKYIPYHIQEFLKRNNLTVVSLRRLLEVKSSWVNLVNYRDESPLFLVLKNKKCTSEIVQLLLEYHADINYRGGTCLFVALKKEGIDEKVIKVLLDNGANVNILDGSGRTPLCAAFRYGFTFQYHATKNIIKLLLDAKCPPNACEDHGYLINCALDNIYSITEDFLDMVMAAGGELNSVDKSGRSPLCIALQNGKDAQVIELLMSKGFSLNACEKHDSAMLCATHSNKIPDLKSDVVQLLLKNNAAMDKLSSGGSPLQWALLSTRYKFRDIKLMVNHSSFDVNASLLNFGNLLHVAVRNRYCQIRVLQLLIDKGVRVYERNANGQTPMEIALLTGLDCHVIKLLFFAGASIDLEMNSFDVSLLQFAFNVCRTQSCPKYFHHFKLLLKCCCLENLDSRIQSLSLEHSKYPFYLRFAENCRNELKRMELQKLDRNHTLRDLASRHRFPQNRASNCNSTMIRYDLNKLLRILSDNEFPMYFDFILTKISRVSMEEKLKEMSVYAIRNCTSSSCIERCIELDYYAVLHITQYLSNEVLMKLIIAFFCSRKVTNFTFTQTNRL